MPIGYLITVALIALGTIFALAPPRRPPVLAAIGFRFGLVVNELPFVAIFWSSGVSSRARCFASPESAAT